MTYEYKCKECGIVEDEHPMGKAPDYIECSCGLKAIRHYQPHNHFWNNCEQPKGYNPKGTPEENK